MRVFSVCAMTCVLLLAATAGPVMDAFACDDPDYKKCVKEAKAERDKCLKRAEDEFKRCKAGDETFDTICWLSYQLDKGVCKLGYTWDVDYCYDTHCDET